MRNLAPTHPICAVVATAALLVAAAAGAVPGPRDPGGAPGSPAVAAPAAASGPALGAAVPPANDDFAAAEIVPGSPFATAASTVEATAAPDDPSCFGNAASVWYAYTPPVSTTIAADTFASDYDTSLSVYTGTPGSLVRLACNDDAGAGVQSQVIVPVVAGVTHYFMAAAQGGAGGNLSFSLDASVFPQVAVRATRAEETSPSAGGEHVAWTQAPRGEPGPWVLSVRRPGEPRERVNRPRTNGFSGGFEGTTFVYQEARGRQSSLQLYDLAGGGRSSPPSGVNTRQWEWHPTLSGDLLLFGRQHLGARTDFVLLRDLDTDRTVTLDRLRWGRRTVAEPGQVAGDYAVWYRCSPTCNVFLHHVPTGTTTRVANPRGRQQYDPSVTSDGTVYFVQSGRGCGTSVRLVRQPLGGENRVLASLGRGLDSFHTYARENDDGTTTLLYERVRCSNAARDVFALVDP